MRVLLCSIALTGVFFSGCATAQPEAGDESSNKPDLPGLSQEPLASSDSGNSEGSGPATDASSANQDQEGEPCPDSGPGKTVAGSKPIERAEGPSVEDLSPQQVVIDEGSGIASPSSASETTSTDLIEPELALAPQDAGHAPSSLERQLDAPPDGDTLKIELPDDADPTAGIGTSLPAEPAQPPVDHPAELGIDEQDFDPVPSIEPTDPISSESNLSSVADIPSLGLPVKDHDAEEKSPQRGVPENASVSSDGSAELDPAGPRGAGRNLLEDVPAGSKSAEGGTGRTSRIGFRDQPVAFWLSKRKPSSRIGFSEELPPDEAFDEDASVTRAGFSRRPKLDSWLRSDPITRVGFSAPSANPVDEQQEVPAREAGPRGDQWRYRATSSWLRPRDSGKEQVSTNDDRSHEAAKAWLKRNLPEGRTLPEFTNREYAQVETWLRDRGETNSLVDQGGESPHPYLALSKWLGRRPLSASSNAPASGSSPGRDYSKVMQWLRGNRER